MYHTTVFPIRQRGLPSGENFFLTFTAAKKSSSRRSRFENRYFDALQPLQPPQSPEQLQDALQPMQRCPRFFALYM